MLWSPAVNGRDVLERCLGGGEVPGGGRGRAIEEEVDGAEAAFVGPGFSLAVATRRKPWPPLLARRGLPTLAHGSIFALFGGALTDARSAAREREQVVWAA
jgi:hypothetical protein